MSILFTLKVQLIRQVRRALINERQKSYDALAAEFGVGRSTITNIAKALREETGFARRPRKTQPENPT